MKSAAICCRSSRSLLTVLAIALLAVVCAPVHAQMGGMSTPPAKSDAPMPSPPATASVTVAGGTIDIHYNTPHMRGRKIMGELVPYGKVWRTGANPATTLITSVPLKFGDLLVPAGRTPSIRCPAPTPGNSFSTIRPASGA